MKRPARCPSCGGRIVRGTVVLLATAPPVRTVVCAGCAGRAVLVLAPQQTETICENCKTEPARFCRSCVAAQLGRDAASKRLLGKTHYARRQLRAATTPTKAAPEEWGDLQERTQSTKRER